jgi:PHD/YefM family antitoxin component YafN of YafNO toxin-antitoxin module
MIVTTMQSFVSHIDELLTKMEIEQEPLIIEREGGNLVVMPKIDFDSLILFHKEREEYVQLRDAFFQNSRHSMANIIDKYLD